MLPPSTIGLVFALAALGYGLGCLNTGYYLVRLKTGQDIRTLGSGNAGARNVKRVLGPWGFVWTLAGDAAKAAPAILLARWTGLPDWAWVLVLMTSLAGHIWPVQLQGRGGKGAATALGGLLALSPPAGVTTLVLAAVLRLLSKRTVLSGAVAAALSPFVAWVYGASIPVVVGLVVMICLLTYTHRENLLRKRIGGVEPGDG